MEKNAELTRISNFIEKEVSVANLEQVYQGLFHLDAVMEKAKSGMNKLIAYLQENNVRPEEYNLDLKKKIIFQEGKNKTEIDPYKVYGRLSIDDFLKVVTVNDAALKKIEGGTVLSAELKEIVGKAKDSILVKKMTKNELKEMA